MKTSHRYTIISELREIIILEESVKELYTELRNDKSVEKVFYNDIDLLVSNQEELLVELYKIINTHESVIKEK